MELQLFGTRASLLVTRARIELHDINGALIDRVDGLASHSVA